MNQHHRTHEILARQVRSCLRPAVGTVMLLAALLWSLPAPALAQSAAGDLLRAIVVRITVRNASGVGLCHGFVATVRGDVAYVVTAKHCIGEMSDIIRTEGTDPDLHLTLDYANGGTGAGQSFYWSRSADVLVIPATFTQRPSSFVEECVTCKYYTSFPPGRSIPILSVLSAGGSDPVLSNGVLVTSGGGVPTVVLPTAPGTSGAPVVDIQGDFVGIVSAVLERGGSAAGILTAIVPAQQVEVTVKSAITQFEARTPGPSPEAPASSVPDIVCETSAVRMGCGDMPLGARSRGFMLTPGHGPGRSG